MIECKSITQKYSCITKIFNNEIISDTSLEKGGTGKGIRPHDLLAASFVACLNISLRMICDKLKIPYQMINTAVELIRTANETTFLYKFKTDKEISESEKSKIYNLLQNCPIRQTLSKPINFIFEE